MEPSNGGHPASPEGTPFLNGQLAPPRLRSPSHTTIVFPAVPIPANGDRTPAAGADESTLASLQQDEADKIAALMLAKAQLDRRGSIGLECSMSDSVSLEAGGSGSVHTSSSSLAHHDQQHANLHPHGPPSIMRSTTIQVMEATPVGVSNALAFPPVTTPERVTIDAVSAAAAVPSASASTAPTPSVTPMPSVAIMSPEQQLAGISLPVRVPAPAAAAAAAGGCDAVPAAFPSAKHTPVLASVAASQPLVPMMTSPLGLHISQPLQQTQPASPAMPGAAAAAGAVNSTPQQQAPLLQQSSSIPSFPLPSVGAPVPVPVRAGLHIYEVDVTAPDAFQRVEITGVTTLSNEQKQACALLNRALELRRKHAYRKPEYYWGAYSPSDFPMSPQPQSYGVSGANGGPLSTSRAAAGGGGARRFQATTVSAAAGGDTSAAASPAASSIGAAAANATPTPSMLPAPASGSDGSSAIASNAAAQDAATGLADGNSVSSSGSAAMSSPLRPRRGSTGSQSVASSHGSGKHHHSHHHHHHHKHHNRTGGDGADSTPATPVEVANSSTAATPATPAREIHAPSAPAANSAPTAAAAATGSAAGATGHGACPTCGTPGNNAAGFAQQQQQPQSSVGVPNNGAVTARDAATTPAAGSGSGGGNHSNGHLPVGSQLVSAETGKNYGNLFYRRRPEPPFEPFGVSMPVSVCTYVRAWRLHIFLLQEHVPNFEPLGLFYPRLLLFALPACSPPPPPTCFA